MVKRVWYSSHGICRHGIQTKVDGFIAIGNSWAASVDYMVQKIDKDGGLQWRKTFGGSQQDYGYAVAQTSDEGYILVGSSQLANGMVSGNKGLLDLWLVKLDKSGNVLREKSIGGRSPNLRQRLLIAVHVPAAVFYINGMGTFGSQEVGGCNTD